MSQLLAVYLSYKEYNLKARSLNKRFEYNAQKVRFLRKQKGLFAMFLYKSVFRAFDFRAFSFGLYYFFLSLQ